MLPKSSHQGFLTFCLLNYWLSKRNAPSGNLESTTFFFFGQVVLCCALPALNGAPWREWEVGKIRDFQLFFIIITSATFLHAVVIKKEVVMLFGAAAPVGRHSPQHSPIQVLVVLHLLLPGATTSVSSPSFSLLWGAQLATLYSNFFPVK